jgi:hypothetical protein
VTVGNALAVGVAVTVGDALAVTGADMLGVAVTGADVLGVAVTGKDVFGGAEGAGDEVAGDTVCVAWTPEGWPEPLVSAMPVKAHPASSPTDIDTTATGRHARRRGRRPGWPGPAGLATSIRVAAAPGRTSSGSAVVCEAWMNVRVTGSGSQAVVGRAAPAPASSCVAVGRWAGSLARQRSISGRIPAGRLSRFGGL